MRYVLKGIFDDVFHTGTKAECEMIKRAFLIRGESEYKLEIASISVELIKGFFGGGCEQLGAYCYRGFDVIVTSSDGGMPELGEPYTIGIYEECGHEALQLADDFNFSLTSASALVDALIDLEIKSSTTLKVDQMPKELQPLFEEKKCTCGAKHTSNPNFHSQWCEKK